MIVLLSIVELSVVVLPEKGDNVMSKPDTSIDPRILESAKKEFLLHGYEQASTNVICKNAGVTWGALAKRYSGKDELFCALVSSVADSFKETLKLQQVQFHSMPEQEKKVIALDSEKKVVDFVDYIYDHFDEFRLLIVCSSGSSYEKYLDELVDIVVDSMKQLIDSMGRKIMIQGQVVTPDLIHILVSSNLYGYFEPITHGMSRADARIYVEQLKYFFDIGWNKILNQ